MNPNDQQLNFVNRNLDLLSKHKHLYLARTVCAVASDNGFTSHYVKKWGASQVTACILDQNNSNYAKEYFSDIDVISTLTGTYDIFICLDKFEEQTNSLGFLQKITEITKNYIFLELAHVHESPNPTSEWKLDETEVVQQPNLAWFIKAFKLYGFECDYIEKYLTQYLYQERMFLRFYNSENINSDSISIEQAWQINFLSTPRETKFGWDKFNQIIG
jgi:hypothetical protein